MTSKLTVEQIRACRDNPLAAYLAKRLPLMLGVVLTLNMVCIILLGMGMSVTLDPENTEASHLANRLGVFVLCATVVAAILLMFELSWMCRHKIYPETLKPEVYEEQEEEYAVLPDLFPDQVDPLPMPAVKPPKEESAWRITVGDLRAQVAMHKRLHAGSQTAMERDYHRSMEIHLFTLAAVMEAAYQSLEEKELVGWRGSHVGTQQLEMTRANLQRIVRIVQQSTRKLWPHNRKKALDKR